MEMEFDRFYCKTNGKLPKREKNTSKLTYSIAQLDVLEVNGSQKGSKMAPTLIKPMENHQTSLAGNISLV